MNSRRERLPVLLVLLAAACGGARGGEAGNLAVPPGAEEEGAAPASPTRSDSAAARPVIDSSLIPEPGAALERERFDYSGGSRDPFASLLEGKSIGPELGDLDLVGVMYDPRDSRVSSVVLRDRVSGKQYTAREGERVGRARVTGIGTRTVTFIVDDFGSQREVTLAMRKQEDAP